MAINKDYVKKKVAQAIKQMPSVGIVVREKYSKYKVKKNEKEPKTAIWWAIMMFC